jgi:nicotinate-nucleotide pyrophosphorylase (carboxylating)
VPRALQITSISTIPTSTMAVAKFLAKNDGVVSGLAVAEQVLKSVDPELSITWSVAEGAAVKKGVQFGVVRGRARSILTGALAHYWISFRLYFVLLFKAHCIRIRHTVRARVGFAGERLALNILQRMSGIATATRRLVALIPASSKTKCAPSNTINFGLLLFRVASILLHWYCPE